VERAVRLREISRSHPRWGWRKAHAILRRESWAVNKKRTRRLWTRGGLEASRSDAEKKRRVGSVRDQRQPVTRPDQVWALDYQTDVTAEGRQVLSM
jgi:hypothetical protein